MAPSEAAGGGGAARANAGRAKSQAESDRAAARVGTAIARAGVVGAALRGGLGVAMVARNLARLQKGGPRHGKATARELANALAAASRFGAFTAAFAGIYTYADEALAQDTNCRRKSAWWRASLAGLLAGPSLLIAGGGTWTTLSVYLSLRAGLLFLRIVDRLDAPWARAVAAARRFPHWNAAVMSLSSSQILYSYFMAPDTLPRTYVKFLDRHVGKPRHVVDALTELCARNATVLADPDASLAVAPLRAQSAAGPAAAARAHVVPQTLFRPRQGAVEHFVRFTIDGFRRALPVYVPVYIVPFLLVHRKRLLRPHTAMPLAGKLVQGIARSAAFLSAYCGLAWVGVDAVMPFLPKRRVAGRRTTSPVFTGAAIAAGPGSLAGLATLLEKPSRRTELALYCASRAVESLALFLDDKGMVPRGAGAAWSRYRMDVALFSLSTAVILGCYSAERETFRNKYLSVIDWVFGNVGHLSQRIRHVPSLLEVSAPPPASDGPEDGSSDGPEDGSSSAEESSLSE